jgi:hypothetical protein
LPLNLNFELDDRRIRPRKEQKKAGLIWKSRCAPFTPAAPPHPEAQLLSVQIISSAPTQLLRIHDFSLAVQKFLLIFEWMISPHPSSAPQPVGSSAALSEKNTIEREEGREKRTEISRPSFPIPFYFRVKNSLKLEIFIFCS